MANPNEIKFHKEDESWGEFSNYYPARIKVQIPALLNTNGEVEKYLPIGELEFSTSEALFHALKFTQEGNVKENIIKKISGLGPDAAKKEAETYNNNGYDLTHWWYNGWGDKAGGYCIRAMKWAVREKFKQNPKLKEKLLETGKIKIIENTAEAISYNDEFWGNGNGMTFRGRKAKYPKGGGENRLGQILMEIRTELRNENSKDQLHQAQNNAINEITTALNQTPQITDSELNSSYQNWKQTLEGFTDQNRIENFKNEVLANIKSHRETKLAADKNNQLHQAQNNAINEITTALNQTPQITDSELNSSYQNWKQTLEGFTDQNRIENFKNEVLANIKSHRETKLAAEKVKKEVENAQNKSGEELRQDLKNLKKKESDKSHQEQQENIEKLSKRSAQEDPESYRKMAIEVIKENIKNNQIEESEIEKIPEIKDDLKKIKDGEINQPEEIINTEKKINKKVNEVGAQKRIDKVVEMAHQALKLATKEELKKAIEEIIKFISSSNIYDQAIYSQQQTKINQLKSALENSSVDKSNSNLPPKNSLWKKVIPVSLLVILVGAVMITIIKIINMRKKRQKKKS